MRTNSWRVVDAACRTLRDYSDGTFPVSPLQIAKSMGICVVDKADIMELIDFVAPHGAAVDAPAFTFACGGRQYIALDRSSGDAASRRACLAHELGHIVLGDSFGDGGWDVQHLVRGTFQRSLMDLSCDLFATSLLVPQAVLAMGGVRSAAEIARVCRVHHSLAYLTAGAMQLRKDGYREAELEAWERMADGLRERVLQVRQGIVAKRPAWLTSDISAELIF